MLSMGFQEDVEAILAAASAVKRPQISLFSATIPAWVNGLVEKKLKKPVWVDVAAAGPSTNENIMHQCTACHWQQKPAAIADFVRVHAGKYGKALVFCDKKTEANELKSHSLLVGIAGVLHGDVAQRDREATLESFRTGALKCLIATDVAARGLDIPSVDLVINVHPPMDVETYVHRAGRTARAGKKGTALTCYTMNEQAQMRMIMHRTRAKFERVGPPQLAQIVEHAARDAVKTIDLIHQDNIEAFQSFAQELIAERGAEVALAAALAAMAGHERRLARRSLLTSEEGRVCLQVRSS